MLTFVCEVSKTRAGSNSVLPKEGSSAKHPTHAGRNFNLDFSASLSNTNTPSPPVDRHSRKAGDMNSQNKQKNNLEVEEMQGR